MKKVIHPFLIATAPILFLYTYNIEETPAADLLLPVSITIGITLILLFTLGGLVKDYGKAAIITSYALILFFSYGHVRELVFPREGTISPFQNIFLVSLWSLLLVVGTLLIIKYLRNFSGLVGFLNVAAAALIIISLVNIGVYSTKTPTRLPEVDGPGLIVPTNPPDVYYIILDMYGRGDILKERFDYDNSDFITYLTSRGFYVASKSKCNYSITSYSLPASLNLRYLEETDESVRFLLVVDSKVSRLLESCGYRYIHIPTGFIDWKDMSRYAEVYSYKGTFGVKVTEFMYGLTETTILAPFARFFGSHGANSILNGFDVLANMPNIEGPKFVFAHIMCPHPPWLFDEDGPKDFHMFRTPEETREGYIDNLMFINKKVKVLVDELLTESNPPPIIIIQGDTALDGKPEILNSYYFPDGNYDSLYETISPVNSFRVIFNQYFGANYELLEDENRGVDL